MNRQTFEFNISLRSVNELTADLVDHLYVAGCSDGTVFQRAEEVWIAFDRESDSLENAI